MGLLKKDIKFWESAITNTMCYDFYFDKIKELSISSFEWTGLPESIDQRYMELMLFDRGGVVFFEDEVMGHLVLPYTFWGRFNVYRIPQFLRAFADNGYNKNLDASNSVMIFNNVLRTSSIRDCKLFARRLAGFDRVIDVNVNAQKTPVLIRCSEKERLTLLQLYKSYEGNEPFVFGDEGLSPDPLDVVNTQAPYVADKIYDLKTKFWNEMLTFKGISNLNVQKKERLISDEVARSQGGTIASRYSGLMMRQQACKKINKMFGLNIWCEFRDDIDAVNNDDGSEPDPGEVQEDE